MKLLHAGPQITSGDITTFESEIGGQFPDDYRQFLLEFNGGVPTPPVGISWNEWIEGVTFYSLEKTSDSGLRRAFKELDETDSSCLFYAQRIAT